MPRKSNQNEEVTIKLRRFDMGQIKDDKVIVFIGKRGTGKSVLVVDYLYHHRQFPIVSVVSPTDNFNLTYRPHVPSIFIHEEYTGELIEQILKRQKDICQSCKSDPAYAGVDPKTCVILDDCLADGNDWVKDKNIKWIFMNGRHAKVTFILTMQYCMGIPPSLRTNVDYIFICKEPKITNQKRLYEQYAGMFPCFEMFRSVLTKCTKDFGCLVIDNSSNSDKIEDQVFWYRVGLDKPDLETFKLCYPVFWKNNDVYLAGKDKRKDVSSDYSKISTKRSGYTFSTQLENNNTK